jgi:photosystem II stability/assembly factor-like uncharacterized protein
MRTKFIRIAACIGIGIGIGSGDLAYASESAPAPVPLAPAHAWHDAARHAIFGVARAGKRLIAVGAHGIVLLSDDDGRTYRQARAVPAAATLSDVYFADASHGWAVGQWGVVLATDDGGETWTLQRADTSTDQPLFSVYFADARRGWAVGLWSLMLKTEDGGAHWSAVQLPPPPGAHKADRNLFHIFARQDGTLFVAAEQGYVLRSRDGGASWAYTRTGGKASLWAGTVAPDGAVFVGGLLGHVYVSRDDGENWSPVDTGTQSSITALVASDDGVLGVGLDGLRLSGHATDPRLMPTHRQGREALTALVLTPATHKALLFSKDGVVSPD